MSNPETSVQEGVGLCVQPGEPLAPARDDYLNPARYFHFYMLFEPEVGRTCWLPAGYSI